MREAGLSELFKTEERIRILRYVAGQRTVTATAVVEATGTSKALVSRSCTCQEEFCAAWPDVSGGNGSLATKRLLNIDLLRAQVRF